MPWETMTLNDGCKMPTIAFGTWKMRKDSGTVQRINQAVSVGFRHVDTAQAYRNEKEAGTAIRQSGIARENLFITAKYSGLDGLDMKTSIKNSLENLEVTYLDLYLIHYPRLARPDIATVWEEMEELKERGLVRSIGVANFGVDHLTSLLATAKVKPAVNQIPLHPYLYAEKAPILEYASTQGIVIEAYNTLIPVTKRRPGPLDVPVDAIATRLNVTADQVLLAWVKAKGAVVVTTSSKKLRLEGYLNAGDISLTDADVAAIDGAGAVGARYERFKRACAITIMATVTLFYITIVITRRQDSMGAAFLAICLGYFLLFVFLLFVLFLVVRLLLRYCTAGRRVAQWL
ncbi:Aldo/keto reductase [Mycena floridula]|nr:Aldo/keto reductase [Mycena floridula]